MNATVEWLHNFTVENVIDKINVSSVAPINIYVNVNYLGYFEILFYSICLFVVLTIVHEIGHAIMLWWYARVPVIIEMGACYVKTGTHAQYLLLSRAQRINVYACGIIAGALFIFLCVWVHDAYMSLIPAYVWGVWGDIDHIRRELRENRRENEKKE